MIVDGVNVLPKNKQDGLVPTGTWAVWAKLKKGTRIFCIQSDMKITEAIALAAEKQKEQATAELYIFHVEADYKAEKKRK